jgi:DNA replication protein DnaC
MFDYKVVKNLGEICFRMQGIACLTGQRGTGKTQIAVELAVAWCTQHFRKAYYTRAADLFASLKREFETDTTGVMMAKCSQVGLLIIDELQEVMGTKWEDNELTRLLDKRYAARVPTIIIANVKADQLVNALGASVVDRMRETGGIIEMLGPSFRRKALP